MNGVNIEIIVENACLSFRPFVSVVFDIILITLETTRVKTPITSVKYPNTCAPKIMLAGESVNKNRKYIRKNDALVAMIDL